MLFYQGAQASCKCSETLSVEEFNELKQSDVTKGYKVYELLGEGKELTINNNYSIEIHDLRISPANPDNCLCTYVANEITSEMPQKLYFVVEERPVSIPSDDLIYEVFKLTARINDLNLTPRERSTPEGQAYYQRRGELLNSLKQIELRKKPPVPIELVQTIIEIANSERIHDASVSVQSKKLDALESDIKHLETWISTKTKS